MPKKKVTLIHTRTVIGTVASFLERSRSSNGCDIESTYRVISWLSSVPRNKRHDNTVLLYLANGCDVTIFRGEKRLKSRGARLGLWYTSSHSCDKLLLFKHPRQCRRV